MSLRIARRSFLKLAAAGGASMGLPVWGCASPLATSTESGRRFFSPAERSIVEALCDAILPGGEHIGAVAAGAVEYIDRFLAALEAPVAEIFRGGPFSGRAPYPDPSSGEPGERFPENGFADFIPPTRLQELAFRIELYGSRSVPNGDLNDAILGARAGLRAVYRSGIEQLRVAASAGGAESFDALDPAARLAAFDATPREFREALLRQLAEGLFCAPEYGGNRRGAVWRDYDYDGDSQPLGYTLFDAESGEPRDRPDRPNQHIDPRRDNSGFEPDVEAMLDGVVMAVGGKRFF